ncbi:MAG: class II fructose-bisphosphate aldolase [Collinsella sp.]|nr:class II fructose-bisphosphate aldolase [Collinsella sp.]
MLVPSGEMLKLAHKDGYAIPSPDFVDSNSCRAYVRVADELDAPLILSFAEVHMDHLSLEEAADLGRFHASRAKAPIALHLDHGVHMEVIEEAIRLGFTSVMVDASREDLDENIRLTREVCALAHAHGVTVEAEIGHVGTEDDDCPHGMSANVYTEVDAAVRLVKETGVDSLAVSIGTAHGAYKGVPHINFERLAELNEALGIPLVLHGGSGSGDDNLARCAMGGVAKVNLYTDFIVAALDRVYGEHPEHWLDLLETGSAAMRDVLRHYYGVLRCAG